MTLVYPAVPIAITVDSKTLVKREVSSEVSVTGEIPGLHKTISYANENVNVPECICKSLWPNTEFEIM